MHNRHEEWHPDYCQHVPASSECLAIFKSHIQSLLANPQPGADVFPDDDDATLIELLLYGCPGTPYDGGFFHFSVRATPDYPRLPPRVAFRTVSSTGLVRFNPNFYENGFVCLSILGTWGPSDWKEARAAVTGREEKVKEQNGCSLTNILHVLQSSFSADPLSKEPGFVESRTERSRQYSDQVAYETLRVAVCEQLERRTLPPALHQRAAAHFVRHYRDYIDRCDQLRQRLDGRSIYNVYNQEPYEDTFEFAAVKRRMEKLLPIAKRDAMAGDDCVL